jgi:hypothetical protein
MHLERFVRNAFQVAEVKTPRVICFTHDASLEVKVTLPHPINLAKYEPKVWRRHGDVPLILLRPKKKGTTPAVPISTTGCRLSLERVSDRLAACRPRAQPVLPLKINQSPCEVAMNSNIGNDIHEFVREAMNACRANAASAGGPPCSAPIIRLLAGQMIPQTFSNITKP